MSPIVAFVLALAMMAFIVSSLVLLVWEAHHSQRQRATPRPRMPRGDE